jgi:hypothetical protein
MKLLLLLLLCASSARPGSCPISSSCILLLQTCSVAKKLVFGVLGAVIHGTDCPWQCRQHDHGSKQPLVTTGAHDVGMMLAAAVYVAMLSRAHVSEGVTTSRCSGR